MTYQPQYNVNMAPTGSVYRIEQQRPHGWRYGRYEATDDPGRQRIVEWSDWYETERVATLCAVAHDRGWGQSALGRVVKIGEAADA